MSLKFIHVFDFSLQIFNKIREVNANSLDKIGLISGDITVDGLQLGSNDELKLINEVNVVFHIAANIKFNDPIKDAVNINVTGTLRVLQLAKRMKNLQVFSYMSTAFCQSFREDLEEKHYRTCVDAEKIIEKTELMDDESLVHLEKELYALRNCKLIIKTYRVISFLWSSRLEVTKHRNTYTLSKALAEDVVYSYRKTLPIVILRPSLVWSAVNEPCEGYIEGMQSMMGLICGALTGFIRTMYVPKGIRIRYTPVDFVISATIASAWKRGTTETEDVLFYNCTDVDENPMTWRKCIESSQKLLVKYAPFEKIIWYPRVTCTGSFYWHLMSLLLFQLVPAFFLDGVRFLSGKKPM